MAGLTKVASDLIEFRAGVDAEFDSVTVNGEPSSEDQVASRGYTDARYLRNIDGGYQDLTYNGDFIKYANKTGTSNWYDYQHPDGWIYSDDGSDGKIGYDATEECCKIVTSSDGTSMSMKQGLHEFLRWQKTLRGKQVSATLRIKASSNVVCRLYDGVTMASGECSGPDEYEDISLTLAVDAEATGLWVDCITSGTTETIELFEVYCNIGPVPLQALPKKVDYIGLWQGQENDYPDNILEGDATEIPEGYTRLESFLNGRFGVGGNGRSKLPEYQGRFLRVWDNGLGNDPDAATRADRGDGTGGDVSGSKQEDAMQGHWHAAIRTSYTGAWGSDAGVVSSTANFIGSNGMVSDPITDGTHGTPRISSESRSININVLAGIRWC